MKLEGEYLFDGPQEEVWKLVRDPEVISIALPGAQRFDQVGDNEYEGQINVHMGPVAGVFSGRLVVSDEIPPESCTLTVEGRGKPGFLKGSGNVHLAVRESGKTLMKYDGEVQIGGRLASVGQRMLDTASKSMIRQGLDALNEALKARLAVSVEDHVVEYTPPSETEYAVGVARDIAGSMLSSKWVWSIVVAVAVIILVIFLLTNTF
jgi:carbon monoxide dehydrogenase subunit G